MGFRKKLTERQVKADTLVCVGLDPLVEKMPECISNMLSGHPEDRRVLFWMTKIVEATAPFACMFKPQIAHWEAMPGGVSALCSLISYIHDKFPDTPVFLDCKRGDIGRTQQQYQQAHLVQQDADGMNFSPYMGEDCMSGLISEATRGKALVGLCYTSNPKARKIQDLALHDYGDRPLWEVMSEFILQWAEELGVVEDAGLVMAAAHTWKGLLPKYVPFYGGPTHERGADFKENGVFSYHLYKVRERVGDKLWFLIPGIGAQQGFAKETVQASYKGPGSIAINSSSEIDFASSGPDYAEAAAQKAKELRDFINHLYFHWEV